MDEETPTDNPAEKEKKKKPPPVMESAKVEAAATLGHQRSQLNLGLRLEGGRGVPKDDAKAAEWYAKSAEQGDHLAQYNLALMYNAGRGVSKDPAKAAELLMHNMLPSAQFCLAGMYRRGVDGTLEPDDSRAVELYRNAAEQGHVRALCNLGFLYQNGKGAPKDEAGAADCYAKAAAQGHVKAKSNLGFMYLHGLGVDREEGKAADLFEQAAAEGDRRSMFFLGLMHDFGRGKNQNYPKAIEYYEKAEELGHERAKEFKADLTRKDDLETAMQECPPEPPEKIEEAKADLLEWKEKHEEKNPFL